MTMTEDQEKELLRRASRQLTHERPAMYFAVRPTEPFPRLEPADYLGRVTTEKSAQKVWVELRHGTHYSSIPCDLILFDGEVVWTAASGYLPKKVRKEYPGE